MISTTFDLTTMMENNRKVQELLDRVEVAVDEEVVEDEQVVIALPLDVAVTLMGVEGQ